MPVRASMCCARSSARITCSVKNLEPTMIRDFCALWQEQRRQTIESSAHKKLIRSTGWRTSRHPQTAFKKAQNGVSQNSEEGCRNSAGKEKWFIYESNSAKDERAKAARANRGRNGGDADGNDRGSANPCQYDGKGQGKTHSEQDLSLGHAHGFGGFKNRRVNSRKTNIGIAQNGQQCIENQSDDRGTFTDATNERNGDEESK